MSRLRVMRVISRMNVGGPAVQVSGLMRALPTDLFEQRLFVGQCGDDEEDYLATQASDIVAQELPGLGRSETPLSGVVGLHALRREIQRFRPHIVHTHTSKAGALGRVASVLSGVDSARVHTFHGHLLHGYFSPMATRALIAAEKSLATSCDRLVAVGPQVRDDLVAAGIGRAEQFAIIPPGLALPPLPEPIEARLSLGLELDRPVVAFMGRLAPVKRVDRFLEVVERVSAARPHVQFVVAGGGADETLLREVVEARGLPVLALGWRSDIETVLAASDLIILTSDNEGTPVSIIQAALAGVPAVATDVGSVRDIVTNGNTGWLTSCDSIDIAKTVLEATSDLAELQRRGNEARSAATRAYSTESLVSAHTRLYLDIARRRHE